MSWVSSVQKVLLGLVAAAWLGSAALLTVHALGVISTPGVFRILDTCPSAATGLDRLCEPVNVRVREIRGTPDEDAVTRANDDVELTGPVEVSLTLMQPTLTERLAFQAPAGVLWATIVAFLTPFSWRAVKPRKDAEKATSDDPLALRLAVAGVVLMVGGVSFIFAQRWSVDTLAERAGPAFAPASALSMGGVAIPSLLGLALVAIGMLERVNRRQRDELEGLV